MPWSKEQVEDLSSHLARHPRACPRCGADDWEGRGIIMPAAGLTGDGTVVDASRNHVEAAGRACGHLEAVDREDAGVPGRTG